MNRYSSLDLDSLVQLCPKLDNHKVSNRIWDSLKTDTDAELNAKFPIGCSYLDKGLEILYEDLPLHLNDPDNLDYSGLKQAVILYRLERGE